MDDSSNIASNVARAIAAALDWSSSPEAKKAAVSYLESIKNGDIRILANASFLLVRKDWSSEIRLHAFKMLQHLVRLRWDEFSSTERRNFANVAIDLISEMANPREEWALKSQTAALVAEIVRREGSNLWQELLPSLVSLSNKGPVEAELVAMILRWLPEDITVHNEDLEGDRRRLLLRSLTQSVPEIFPLLYNLLEKHFGAALIEANKQQFDIVKQHAATVTAALNAVNAYAEWAPVPEFAKYGLIHGCSILLSSAEFRLHASEFFKLVSQRKRPVDSSAPDFDSAMSTIFQILMNVSRDFLYKSCSGVAAIDDSEYEFAECICESMVALGCSNIQCIVEDVSILSPYLQQMLGYFQHCKFALHCHSLIFWLALTRESFCKAKIAVHTGGDTPGVSNSSPASGQGDKEKKGLAIFIDDDICATILDVSFQRLLKKTVSHGTPLTIGALELWSDDFEGKGDFSQYRSRLLELIRLVVYHKPLESAANVSHRIVTTIKSYTSTPAPSQDVAMLESMKFGLETVVNAAFDSSTDLACIVSEVKFGLHRIFEDLLQQLLCLKWTGPALSEILGRYLDSFGPFLECFPDAVRGVINKLFELLTSLPCSHQDPSAITARHARLQICTSFIRIAKTANKSLLPHMKDIADTMAYLQGEGKLLRAEHNLLGEAFLVMASSAGIQQQQEVLAWLLEPLNKQWTQSDWQNAYLSDSFRLTHLCSDTQFMWSIFHTVTFFEKALKRSGIRKGNINLQNSSLASDASSYPHPLSCHLSWMLPPLLRLLCSIHGLWSQPVIQALPGEIRVAMSMGPVEQACLLGEGIPKLPKGQLTFVDGPQMDMNEVGCAESNENDLRNWLKGIRDSGYNVLGLSATLGDSFFQSLESKSVALALMENIQSMEFRHIRQLIHLVLIPLIKSCPPGLRDEWLQNLLLPLFNHCQQALSCSWSSLLREDRAKVPDFFVNLSGLDLKVEVMEEKLLRDLTREICHLLSILASPALNNDVPTLEQLGSRIEVSSLKDLDTFHSNSLIGFLLRNKSLALPALQISIEAFSWTDGDAVGKLTSFCGIVILLAISTSNVAIKEFVAKDLFYAIIQGLALESNAIISADLVGLCREIFVYLSDRDPSPRQVLLSLPCIRTEDLLAFEEALAKTSSVREQKQHMRSLLLLATGNKLKALAGQKITNAMTNVSNRPRNSVSAPGSSVEDDDVIGLAAIT